MHSSPISSRTFITRISCWASALANRPSNPVGTSPLTPRPTACLACVPTWHEDFRKDLTRIDVPTLVIQGDADRILPIAASGLRTAKLINGARLLVVKDGPHCITWTHADQVNTELVKFLGNRIA